LSLLKTRVLNKQPKNQDDQNSRSGPPNIRGDIYSGEESIRFDNRHPVFKTLMKLEFEDVLRNFSKKYKENLLQ